MGNQEVADANMKDPLSRDTTLALPSCTIPFLQDHPQPFPLLLVWPAPTPVGSVTSVVPSVQVEKTWEGDQW